MRPCTPFFCRQTSIVKIFFTITTFSLFFFIVFLQANERQAVDIEIVQQAISNAAQDARYAEIYRYKHRLPNNLKYILLWTPKDWAPFNFFGTGQKKLIEYNCSTINCYVTDDENFLGDVTQFDAIAFNGRNLIQSNLPKHRSPRQKYIYFNTESAEYFPVCNNVYDSYFNWTATYRLDSDIPYNYISIKDINGNTVGPKIDMKWIDPMKEVDANFSNRFANKTKAAAWFVSNCKSRSRRMKYVKDLMKSLVTFGLKIDIYGKCGQLRCPKDNMMCEKLLERDYYFYLSFENSFAEDYVTEKLLTALHHGTVPIVFGGANYSRYLPPNSYINARQMSPAELASNMASLIESPSIYSQYFKWRNYYTYHDPRTDNVCAVCTALNNKSMVENQTVYKNLRKWWNPNFESRCLQR